MSTLRDKLEALAGESCIGADEYREDAVYSAKAQAMARALITFFDGFNGLVLTNAAKQLDAALDKADEIL